MKPENFFFKAAIGVLLVLCVAICASQANAELKIDSVYPTMGIKGKDLPITISGRGFDANTRVSMSIDTGNRKAILGSFDLGFSLIYDVAVSGTTAYAVDLLGYLYIIDITNPSTPKIMNDIELTGFPLRIAVSDSKAYVACESGGLQVIDLSQPSSPKIIGGVYTHNITGVAVSGSEIYASNMTDGFYVIDADTYEIIGSVAMPSENNMPFTGTGIAISGRTAYVANGDGLQIIDVRDPQNPILKGSFPISYAISVAVSDSKAYVGDLFDGLQVIDVSSSSNPYLLGKVSVSGGCYGVVVSGSEAYIAAGYAGLYIADVSNPSKPKIISTVHSPGDPHGIAVSGSTAYLAASESLQMIDVSNTSASQEIVSVNTIGNAVSIAVSDSKAYVAANGVQIIDISNLSTPKIISDIRSPYYPEAKSIVVSNSKAYIVFSNSLVIADVGDPLFPYIINVFRMPDTLCKVAVSGSKAYAISASSLNVNKLNAIDVSNPVTAHVTGDLILDGELTCSGSVGNIAASDNMVYVPLRFFMSTFTGGGLKVINANSPSDIFVASTVNSVNTPMNTFTSVAISGSIAYVADYKSLYVIDVSNPYSPEIISITDIPISSRKITLSGSAVYVAHFTDGLVMIDVSNPANPIVIGTISKPANDVAIVGNKALIASGDEGLVIVPIPVEVKPTFINDTTISVTLPSPPIPGNYNIRVFNNNNESSEVTGGELKGAVSFVPPEESYLLDTKAIIVVGDKSGNNIRSETFLAADYAYKTLLYQGYTAESINYLSSDTSQPGVDAKASFAAISEAVNNWSIRDPKATELLIYLVGHGQRGYFMISDNEQLNAEQLDEWLDNLQNTYNIPVTVIYDACYSGTFLPKLTPPPGRKRIVISGASAEEAYFINGGRLSASYQFWDAVYQGNEIGKAFGIARNQMKSWQTALIDADGDGISTEADIALAENMRVRRNYKSQNDVPYIYDVSEPQVLHDETSAKIIAGVSYVRDGTEIQRVWATIEPPDFKPGSSDIPVTSLPEIELTDPDGDGIYEGVYNQFLLNGTYKIKVCATNQKGMYALFRDTAVVRETGYIAALSPAQVVSRNSAKLWASVNPDIPVKKVWAEIQPPSAGSSPVELVLSDPENDGIYEAVFDNFSAEGTYAVKLYSTDTQGYTSPAVLTTVTYSSGIGKDEYEQDDTALSATAIRAGETQQHNFHTAADTDWLKILMVKGVTYNIGTANQQFCRTSADFYRKVIPGDVSGDNAADLQDVIAALRVVTGLENNADIYADVNSDGKIGLEEALYGLRGAAGLTTKTGISLALLRSSDSAFDWTCPATGIYYLKVGNRTPDVFGQNVRYDVRVIRPSAGVSGKIRGTLKSSPGEPVSDAEIFTDGGGSDLSRDNGAFSIEDSVGEHVITVRADGYEEYRSVVTFAETGEQIFNIVMTHNR